MIKVLGGYCKWGSGHPMVGCEGNEPKQGGVGGRRPGWWLGGIMGLDEGGGGKEIVFGIRVETRGGGG